MLVVCCYDRPVSIHIQTLHTLPPKPSLTKTPTFLLIGLRVKGENGWGWLWGVERGRRRKCDLFFLCVCVYVGWGWGWGVPRTQWGGLVSLGVLTKDPQFSLLLDSSCISTVISLSDEAQLGTTNWEQNTKCLNVKQA